MNKKVTAEELMAELNAEPEYVAARAAEERVREKRAAEWRRSEASLVEELQLAGLAVDSVWDLVNSTARYPNALPILMKHLQRPYPGEVREGIARALAVPGAKFAWNLLMRLYQDEHEARPKDGLAVALAAISDDETIDDVIALAKNARNGPSRLLLLSALERSFNPRAHETLVELEKDPELSKEIAVILRRVKRGRHRGGASSGDA